MNQYWLQVGWPTNKHPLISETLD